MTVYNVPTYAKEYNYMVARECDGKLWFYGAYETKERATEVAIEVRGIVVEQCHRLKK